MNFPITNTIEEIIKNTHIFNNVILTSCPCIIKTSSKLDIWNFQTGMKTKCSINRCFNIE